MAPLPKAAKHCPTMVSPNLIWCTWRTGQSQKSWLAQGPKHKQLYRVYSCHYSSHGWKAVAIRKCWIRPHQKVVATCNLSPCQMSEAVHHGLCCMSFLSVGDKSEAALRFPAPQNWYAVQSCYSIPITGTLLISTLLVPATKIPASVQSTSSCASGLASMCWPWKTADDAISWKQFVQTKVSKELCLVRIDRIFRFSLDFFFARNPLLTSFRPRHIAQHCCTFTSYY